VTASPPGKPALFLVDGYALIYRAFYALISRPLTTSRGENTSAAWGVVNFLNRLVNTHRPEYLAWVHDSGSSFRKETFPDYKATREKLAADQQADFDRGMERIAALLQAYRVPVVTLPGYEADDVIGALAVQAVEKKINVVIVSGDKDFQQLVRPGIWLLNPGRGGPANVEEHWVSMDNATERLGVPPSLVTDYLALVGDSSDNIPGVKGIGDKGAAELVNTYGALEDIIARASEITKKRPREALLEQVEAARLSKRLVTIKTDVDIKLDPEAFRAKQPDNRQLRALLVELEFHTLARQIADEAAPEDSSAPETEAPRTGTAVDKRYTTITTAKALADLVARARKAKRMSMAVFAAPESGAPLPNDPLRSVIVGFGIALGAGDAHYVPLAHRRWEPSQTTLGLDDGGEAAPAKKSRAKATEPESLAARALAGSPAEITNLGGLDHAALQPLRELLEDPAVRKSAANGKFDLLALRHAGVALAGLDFETSIASYLLDPGRRAHGIEQLSLEFLQEKVVDFEELCGKGKNFIPYDQVPVATASTYACERVDVVGRLRTVFEPQLQEMAARKLMDEIELPLLPVLADMEATGITIDIAGFAQLKKRFEGERLRLEKTIHEAAGREFNINSPLQLREILFDKLQLPVLKKTPSGPSTDASVLQQLSEMGHEFPALLMEYRSVTKLEGTYIDTLPALINPRDGRLHTTYNQTVAATGRLSSEDPNLQNIPIRTELGREIRKHFIPRKSWKLLSADYSQIELRLLAHLSADKLFVDAFKAGGDIHKQTAALIFEVPVDQVSSEMRARAKTINFATIYGQGAHALSLQLKITNAEAKEFIERYFQRFAGVRKFLDSCVEFARENGYVQTLFGRRRYIPEVRERNFNIRAFGERTAANSPIQGSAADLIKIAMIRVAAAIRAAKLESAMLLQVHDELVFESPTAEVATLQALVKKEMEGAATLAVPLLVDVGVGPNWLESK
jgi:DNA polymerase-1